MTSVFLDFATLGEDADPAPLRDRLPDLSLYARTSGNELVERIRNAECVFLNKVQLTGAAMSQARALRYVGVVATGTDNVDREYAGNHGIAVTNIRGYCTQSVADHVLGAVLMLARNLHRYRAAVREGRWQAARDFCLLDFPIRQLSTMTLGVVGYGDLGQAVAGRARQLGMTVLVSGRIGEDDDRAGRIPFDDLLQRSDVISLHCPLTAATRGLIGADQLARMRDDALLINTARGGLVDSAALVDALQDGRIGGAAIDVLQQEPPVDGDPLLDCDSDNLILTPHNAWASDEARRNALVETAENVRAWQAGERRNRVV